MAAVIPPFSLTRRAAQASITHICPALHTSGTHLTGAHEQASSASSPSPPPFPPATPPESSCGQLARFALGRAGLSSCHPLLPSGGPLFGPRQPRSSFPPPKGTFLNGNLRQLNQQSNLSYLQRDRFIASLHVLNLQV